MFALSAINGGGGAAVSTPPGSHLLGRYSPPRYTPLDFSLKQTAVPAGLPLAGLLGPAITYRAGWRAALYVAVIGCLVFALMLEPLRRRRHAGPPSPLARLAHLQRLADRRYCLFRHRPDRDGLQPEGSGRDVLRRHGGGGARAHPLGMARQHGSGAAGPDRWAAARRGGASALVTGCFTPAWPVVMVGLVASALSGTAMSRYGVLLAEAARLVPPGMRGAATGGVLSFDQTGRC